MPTSQSTNWRGRSDWKWHLVSYKEATPKRVSCLIKGYQVLNDHKNCRALALFTFQVAKPRLVEYVGLYEKHSLKKTFSSIAFQSQEDFISVICPISSCHIKLKLDSCQNRAFLRCHVTCKDVNHVAKAGSRRYIS